MPAEKVIKHVSDTAFWIAAFRAEETDKPAPLFKDPFAKKLAQEKGFRIAKSMGNVARMRWQVSVRTRLIDELILRAISQGVDVILNLGTGLDTRPYRLDLPHSLHWVEADFAGIIDYKSEMLKDDTPRCNLSRVAVDLTQDHLREKLLQDVSKKGRSVLVLTEGVIPYLSVEQGASLADALHRQENFHFWILDYTGKFFEQLYKQGKMKLENNEPFLFFPENWEKFFEEHHWKVSDMRYMFAEGLRLGRPAPTPLLYKIFGIFVPKSTKEKFFKLSGYALMERA